MSQKKEGMQTELSPFLFLAQGYWSNECSDTMLMSISEIVHISDIIKKKKKKDNTKGLGVIFPSCYY